MQGRSTQTVDDDDGDEACTMFAYAIGARVPDMRVSSAAGQLLQLELLIAAVFRLYRCSMGEKRQSTIGFTERSMNILRLLTGTTRPPLQNSPAKDCQGLARPTHCRCRS